jgi:hypothetical protein
MKNTMIKFPQKMLLGNVCSLMIGVTTVPVLADEVWNSDYGKVVYQADRGKTAIWTYGDGSQGSMFIEGLAGQYKYRGTYYGYWSQSTSRVRCETYREGRDGKFTYYWGSLRIQFLEPKFPSRWSAVFGYCNQFPTSPWRGFPIVGNGLTELLKLP